MARETDLMNLLNKLESLEERVRFLSRLETPDATEFSPTDLASLRLWYDFQDVRNLFTDAGATRVFANSAPIYQANDKSAHADHALQATSTARPAYTQILNDLSAGLFDGTTDYMVGPTNVDLSAGFSIFAVIRPTTTSVGNRLCTIFNDTVSGTQNRLEFFISNGGGIYLHAHQDANGNIVRIGRTAAGGTIAVNTTYLLEGYYDGGSTASGIAIYKNGIKVDNADNNIGTFTAVPSTTNVPFRVGAEFLAGTLNLPFNGYIMDVLLFSGELSSADKASVRTYLNDKWKVF